MSRPPIPILTYHQVEPPPARGVPYRSLVVSPGAFARQMLLLRLAGYRGLSMTDLEPYLLGERTGKVVGITLDDGYLNNLQNALPVLRRHHFSATCYVVSRRVGATNVWDSGKGVPAQPLMDAAQLRAWVDGGQEVGSHTRTHADLPTLSGSALEDEIAGAREDLQGLLGRPVLHFCYPYGHYNSAHAELARRAGYRTATTTRRGRAQASDNLLELPRVPVLRTTALPTFWAKVATGYEDGKSG